jgi:hypothetical protein
MISQLGHVPKVGAQEFLVAALSCGTASARSSGGFLCDAFPFAFQLAHNLTVVSLILDEDLVAQLPLKPACTRDGQCIKSRLATLTHP